MSLEDLQKRLRTARSEKDSREITILSKALLLENQAQRGEPPHVSLGFVGRQTISATIADDGCWKGAIYVNGVNRPRRKGSYPSAEAMVRDLLTYPRRR